MKRLRTQDLPEHGSRFIIQAIIRIGRRELGCQLLIDCGATGPILREEWVRESEILVKKRQKPIEVQNASQQPIPRVGVHYIQPVGLVIGKHTEQLVWEVGQIEDSVDGYLPVTWLSKHNPNIDWEKCILQWHSKYCREHCLPKEYEFELVDSYQLQQEVLEDLASAVATVT